MNVIISPTKQQTGKRAASEGAALIRQALEQRGEAFIVLATGASQFAMLATLVRADLGWGKVTGFHLDEYIGLPGDHPASFRRYLRERFVERLPQPLRAFHYISPDQDPAAECARQSRLISPVSVDVAFVGLGENCHLAFNDPPADFETEEPYLIVTLEEACRRQQLGEGWFASLEEVPRQAISMSIRQIMKSQAIICIAPEKRKAEAVRKAIEGPVTPEAPASILQRHADCRFFLDAESACGLQRPQAR
jgi:glucosamine-6-phosphate deaminase